MNGHCEVSGTSLSKFKAKVGTVIWLQTEKEAFSGVLYDFIEHQLLLRVGDQVISVDENEVILYK
ncbi:hypothetical protein EQV77_12155 [Halobacillus fulvus]|nr:hypothetical protein EQV77_12155 [Halobacillus fulvus]